MKPSGSSERERTNQCSLNSNSSFLKTNLAQGYKKPWVFYFDATLSNKSRKSVSLSLDGRGRG